MSSKNDLLNTLAEIADLIIRTIEITPGKPKDFRVRKIMNELGYKQSRNGIGGGAFMNRERDFVIKFPNICSDTTPLMAIPTEVRKIKPSYRIDHDLYPVLLVQPRADISPRAVRVAHKAVMATPSRTRPKVWGSDAEDNPNNIGLYDGRPVVFDW